VRRASGTVTVALNAFRDSVIQKIDDIYKARSVVGRSGTVHRLHSAIDPEKGDFLFNIIRGDLSIVKTLEVGCGYGLSSLFICSALQERHGAAHTIIDPYENGYWDGVGIKNLEDAGLRFFTLIECKSEFALPTLLEQGEGQFDFIFIDGWHTFDHTLLDCFYATRLLCVGGYLAIDDVNFPSVRRAVEFLRTYPCYAFAGSVSARIRRSSKEMLVRRLMSLVERKTWARLLSRDLYRTIFEDDETSMVALKKATQDTRDWDWHDEDSGRASIRRELAKGRGIHAVARTVGVGAGTVQRVRAEVPKMA
jgi:predicted O-methyltransferase YrrM